MALPGLLDIETLFADPAFSGAKISPDGTKLAYLAPQHGRTQVWVRRIDEEHQDAVCVTRDRLRGIRTFQFTDDPRWLLYWQDGGGNEDWHLFRVDLADPSSDAVDLTPLPPGARIVRVEKHKRDGGKVVVMMNPRLAVFDTFAIDLETGEQELMNEGTSILGEELLDNDDVARHWAGLLPDGTWEFRTKDRDTGEERVLHRSGGPANPVGIHPLELTPDGTAVILGDFLDGDELHLFRIDIATGERSLFAGLPGRDVCRMGLLTAFPPCVYKSAKTGEIIGVRFVGDRPTVLPVTEDFARVYAELEKLSDGVLNQLSSDAQERLWVASFTHDRDPDLTYLFDSQTGESRLLFRSRPDLEPGQLAPMQAITYTARDGLPIHAFLTLPVGVGHTNLPLVVNVHGGPWANDVWRFDPQVQLLANRGYAVLQPNFRGSKGYGKKHLVAAVKELGGKMHDDLIDGADHLVEKGLVDPTRIAIMGASYGGYSALVGATVTPDFFAAAVDIVGVSSLPNFMGSVPDFVKPTMINNWMTYAGDPSDPEQLEWMLSRSPITMIDKIRVPMLIAQGANDARVVQAESDNVVEALRARGIAVEYLLAEDEGHGFQNPNNVIELWKAIDRFFGVHLEGRTA